MTEDGSSLLDRYLDGELDASDEERFLAWLRADQAHLDEFLRALQLERTLALARPQSRSAPPRRWSRWRTVLVAAAACLAAMVGVVAYRGVADPTPRVLVAAGSATIYRDGAQITLSAGLPQRLRWGDQLRCDAPATISWSDGTVVSCAAGSLCELRGEGSPGKRLGVLRGRFDASVAKQRDAMWFFGLRAWVEVVGTRLAITAASDGTRVEVSEGAVSVSRPTSDQGTVRVAAGSYVSVDEDGAGQLVARPISAPRILHADPTTYRDLLPTLAAGDTLMLAPGTYERGLPLADLAGEAGAWITITGPVDGPLPRFIARAESNTAELTRCHHLALRRLAFDGGHLGGPFAISAAGGIANAVHHLRIERCEIRDYDGSQQTMAIASRCAAWAWTISGNRIESVGGGICFGDPEATLPYSGLRIEGNLVQGATGYCLCLHSQSARPPVPGMPPPAPTVIARNVFLKDDRPSPDGDRPSVLLGGVADEGSEGSDERQLYGNLVMGNHRESLIQASGRVTIHDNLLLDAEDAVTVGTWSRPLVSAVVFHNTILVSGRGLVAHAAADASLLAVGNLVCARDGISTAWVEVENLVQPPEAAPKLLRSPSAPLGELDLHPLPGACRGSPIDLRQLGLSRAAGVGRDFDGVPKGDARERGAYVGSGPGWIPAAEPRP